MKLVAALCASVFVYLLVGLVVGIRPEWQRRRSPSTPTRGERAAVWLEQSSTDVAPAAFLGVVAGSCLVASALAIVITGVPALGVVAGIGGGFAPVVVVEQRRLGLVRARRAAWPDALRDLSTRLRSGVSLHVALVDLGRLGPAPLRDAFVRYEALSGALDQRVALETIRNELAEPVADRIIEVLLVAFDQGGRVVIDVLDDVAESTVADLHLTADVETAQLETKLEARGAAVLPFIVLGLLCLGSNGYRSFYATGVGSAVIVLGLAMSMLGVAVIGRLGRMETEPRSIVHGGRP